jgi:hypothetical protein
MDWFVDIRVYVYGIRFDGLPKSQFAASISPFSKHETAFRHRNEHYRARWHLLVLRSAIQHTQIDEVNDGLYLC